MTDFLKSARRARAAGDLEGAGDLLLMAGRPQEAVDTFLEGKLYARAAEVLESQGEIKEAAELYVKARDGKRAGDLFERLGEFGRAAQFLAEAGETYRAAQLSERAGVLLEAAELYQKVGHIERAAQLFIDCGEPARAGELYEELWLTRDRESPRHAVRTLLTPERIADLGGRAYWKAGEYEKAAIFFSRAGMQDRAAEAYARAGDLERAARAFVKSGRTAQAVALLESKELEESQWALLGDLYTEMEQHLKAAEAFTQAGRLREAAEAYHRGQETTKAAALYALVGDKRKAGDLFHSAGDLGNAARAYEEAGLLELAATCYEEAGNVKRAADLSRRLFQSLSAAPSPGGRARLLAVGKRAADLCVTTEDHASAASIYAEIGLAREAARAFERVGDLVRAGQEMARAGDHESALGLYQRSGQPAPPDVEAAAHEAAERYPEAARLLESLGDAQRAASLYEKGGLLAHAGRLYEQMQEHVRAAECFEAAGEPRRAGMLYQKAGMLDRAAECLERSGEMERAAYVHLLAESFLAAAQCFIKSGKPDDAVVLLQKIKPQHPDYAEGCLRLGDVFFEKGLFSLALEKYYKGLADRPTEERLLPYLYNLALTYEHLERWGEARDCYERILSVDYGYRDVRARREAAARAEARVRTEQLPAAEPAEAAPPAVGTSAGSRFEVKGVLESDDFGVTYRAWDRGKERPVMLRRFSAPDLDNQKLERLLREARTAVRLQHPNVLTVYDVGDEEGVKFMAMEHVEATPLRARLESGERLDPYRAADVGAQVALALDHAHKVGLMHRNLRPETIMLQTPGDIVKVRDFGFADRLTDTLKATGERRYPLLYMAPEQILGRKIDERSDGYSLGVVLYELLYGQPPFTGEDIIYQHVSRPVTFPKEGKVPERLRRVVARCLEKDPARRFQRLREVADELRRAEVEPGTLVEGRYEVQAEIGSGGMGKVYRAWDRELDEVVALKILKSEFGENSEALSRFLREIKLSRKIAHPNVVKVYDMGRFRGSRFISMEFIQGPSLEQWIRDRKRIEILPAVKLVGPILSALQAAHEAGIVHRDVKPQNVLLAGGTTPKIVDFGIARGQGSEGVTLSGEVLGSPKYMSPEHIEEGVLDRRTDLYAMGVLMYLIFTGREPFTGENPTAILLKHIHETPRPPRTLNAEIPTWLEKVILRCLAKDPEQRYQWASEILTDVEAGAGRMA